MATRVWDTLREGGIDTYALLACVSDDALLRLVGPSYIEIATREKEIGKQVLEIQLHNIGEVGLAQPPMPENFTYPSIPSIAITMAKKPFKLPKKSPIIQERTSDGSTVHVDESAKK